ncbi:DUF4349 domain-containing protein [Microbacterium ulmi]|uniref:DUF4349 domain-containing protein n=1 Tax=Microbacterium ulmi TaxID=179095 RepID=A0A7Y2PYS7_9MICO|nr:DUF4349 domain-containing protein [Microbacterium ulmi]NII71269.1 hypothetical protein [Microbacterium ulmi]NNH02573.1 DUF4349 domain-containing protein [Microbacterium ulmi]
MNATTDSVELEHLPELADETIARIEHEVVSGIRRDAAATAKRARRRRTVWLTSGAAAAAIVVLAVVAPSISGLVLRSSGGASVADTAQAPAPAQVFEPDSGGDRLGAEAVSGASDGTAGREVIATARATVLVDDAAAAARAIGDAAAERGGYVESMTLDGSGVVSQSPGRTTIDGGLVYDPSMPYPLGGDWITVRVPADQLADTIAALSELGEVQASAINRQDVTEQTVDLRARIDAAQASVDRLTALMAQAGSVADLITAEQALADRQATLESYQQQLTSLESQISLSSLTVSLVEPAEVVRADPAGFGDGIVTGWNWLLATLNGIVIALGFLLPWLAVAAVAWLVVWGVRRIVKRNRAAKTPVD